ncbi:TPA: hypothetical protein KAC97_004060, partial [Escherichia coli]|nr:hypothetical protein [Escherichia coli]
MLGGADNPNGELPSYITGANTAVQRERDSQFFSVITAELEPVRAPSLIAFFHGH